MATQYSTEKQRELYDLSKKILAHKDIPAKPEAAKEVAQLHEVIVYHEWRYYVLNEPVMSDFEYDHLYKRLEALEQAYPTLVSEDSPTQRVSSDLSSDFESVAHLIPMLSLDNSYNAEDLGDFDKQIQKLTNTEPPIAYCVEPKYDGGSIALVYENDRLVRAATRGNGTTGEEMTKNAKAMKTIPLKAAFSKYGIHKVELRGEVLIRLDRFKKVNQAREKAGKSILANPRNAATGALRVKNPQEVVDRSLEAFIYQLGYAVDKEGENVLDQFPTHDEGIEALANLGFKVPTVERKVCSNIEEAAAFCDHWQQKRDDYAYEIDGMVVKVNNIDLQELCGYTSHHPRWAIAYKFKAKQATTKLLNVEYQVGKLGQVTPVAKLEPVSLAGVTVSSVSLHNEDFIKQRNLHLGDTVLVERAGDVIPYIVKAMEELRDGNEQPIVYPTQCPSCETTLVRIEGEAVWKCENVNCAAQVLRRLEHHVSKNAMDIDGFGEKYVVRFNEMGWLDRVPDVYKLDYDAIANLEGFGKRSAEKLKKAIDTAKGNPISRLLYSFSIPLVGRTVSKIFAGEVNDIRDLKNWDLEQLMALKDIGPKAAEHVVAFFANPETLPLLNELDALGVNMKQLESERKQEPILDGALSGKTILFTGSFQTMKRNDAKALAVAAGAKALSAVSSNLNILVVGEKAGSKLTKAQALGTVEILTEEEFLKVLEKE